MEKLKSELISMIEEISNEKAIRYLHGFVRMFVKRYLKESENGREAKR